MEVNLTLENILKIVDGVCSSVDSNFIIKNIKSLECAGSEDLAVITERGDASVFDSVNLDKIKNSKALILLSSAADVPEKNYIIVPDAVAAFQKIVDYLNRQNLSSKTSANIDSTAIIDSSAVVADGARIGAATVVSAQVFIGRNCIIGAGVLLHPGVKILDRCVVGDGTIIHSGAIIGSDGFGYKVTKQGMQKIPHIGIVRIGRGVEIGANTAIDRASFDETIIGDGVKMDNLIHIAHNVEVGENTYIAAANVIAGSTKIGKNCMFSGQVGIVGHLKIADNTIIAAQSGISKSITKSGEGYIFYE